MLFCSTFPCPIDGLIGSNYSDLLLTRISRRMNGRWGKIDNISICLMAILNSSGRFWEILICERTSQRVLRRRVRRAACGGSQCVCHSSVAQKRVRRTSHGNNPWPLTLKIAQRRAPSARPRPLLRCARLAPGSASLSIRDRAACRALDTSGETPLLLARATRTSASASALPHPPALRRRAAATHEPTSLDSTRGANAHDWLSAHANCWRVPRMQPGPQSSSRTLRTLVISGSRFDCSPGAGRSGVHVQSTDISRWGRLNQTFCRCWFRTATGLYEN